MYLGPEWSVLTPRAQSLATLFAGLVVIGPWYTPIKRLKTLILANCAVSELSLVTVNSFQYDINAQTQKNCSTSHPTESQEGNQILGGL